MRLHRAVSRWAVRALAMVGCVVPGLMGQMGVLTVRAGCRSAMHTGAVGHGRQTEQQGKEEEQSHPEK